MNARLLASLAAASLFLDRNLAAAPGSGRLPKSASRAAPPVPSAITRPTSSATRRRSRVSAASPTRSRSSRAEPSATARATDALKATFGDSWVYDATTDIFADRDRDGYYSYLRVQFDADTIYTYSYVYAEIYVSADGTAWEHLYSTQDFDDLGLRSRRRLRGRDRARLRLLDGPLRRADRALRRRHRRARRRVRAERVAGVLAAAARRLGARRRASSPPPDYDDDDHDGGGGAVSWLGLAGLLGALALRRRRRAA